MAINFNELPSSKPVSVLDSGYYKGEIVKAEMTQSKSSSATYLQITYNLVNKQGKSCGKLWDNLFDSDKEFLRYKLARFITALKIPLTGSFELKDLAKIVVGKSLIIDVGVDDKGQRPRNQVEPFKGDMFYPVEEWASLLGVVTEDNSPVPFDLDEDTIAADDADDADAVDY